MNPSGATLLPTGDSLTEGTDNSSPPAAPGGYRPYLQARLPNTLFVGSQVNTGHHEGHPSFTSANDGTGILGNIATWYAANPGQIVPLHIGTNDQGLAGNDAASAAASASNIAAICDYIHAQSPSAIIFLAKIINCKTTRPLLNAFIVLQRAAMVSAVAGKAWVRVVDMPPLADSDFGNAPGDDVHPSSAPGKGYEKMANAFYAAIVAAMGT